MKDRGTLPQSGGPSFVKPEKFGCVKAGFVLVLKTKFPYYDFFFHLLNLALNLIKIERLKSYPAFEAKNELRAFVKRFDYKYLVRGLAEEGTRLFQRLAQCRSPYFEKPLIVSWEGFQANLTVPEKAMAKFIECKYSLLTVLRYATWPAFLALSMAVMQEKHIVFVHRNRDVLSKFM